MAKFEKIGFIGAGQMAQSMIRALIDTGTFSAHNIFVSSRTNERLQKVVEKFGIQSCSSNEVLIDAVDVVILATKPQDLTEALDPLMMLFREDQIVMSVAAGFTLDKLAKMISSNKNLVRIMPNTPLKIRKAVVGLAMSEKAQLYEKQIMRVLEPLGTVVVIPDGEPFQALTVAAASGTGFIFELMQYWQEWLEGYDIDSETAKAITTQTFLGAAMLAEKQSQMTFEELLSQVTSKKGVTYAGLESMRELEIERMLRLSFEKAVLRDSELSRL